MCEKPAMSIDVIVSQEKLNDFNYVQKRLFETKLSILYKITEASDKKLSDLVKEFLPDIQSYDNANMLLEKYSLSLDSLFKPKEESSNPNTKKVILKTKQQQSNVNNDTSNTAPKKTYSKNKEIRSIDNLICKQKFDFFYLFTKNFKMEDFSREIIEFGKRVDKSLKINILNNKMNKSKIIRDFNILIHSSYLGTDKSGIFKARQYSDAIKIIQTYPEESITDIKSIEEWFKKSGKKNPKSIIDKISDFLKNGYITQAKLALENPQVKAIMELTKIANIGQAKAKELYTKHNIVTIDDLRKAVSTNLELLTLNSILVSNIIMIYL